MSDNSSSNKRIAKNTIMLYFRMMLMMVVALYTSRVILQTLGVTDYGIYNVVGGFVAMFSFLNGSISGGTQRFIAFAIGKGNATMLNKIFSTCFLTHALIALLVIILAETVGLWFVMNKLVIPENREIAAIWVYQCSILSSIIMIMSMPYNADIIAHEKMSAFAYISILEAFLKLGIVFILLVGDNDRLILYAVLHLIVSIVIRFVYTHYCNSNFAESHYIRIWDKVLFKKILFFSGWNLWGNVAVVLMTQGINIVLNLFFGPAVNAARALAVQVQGAINQFSTNFQMAMNPQITKQYAGGNLEQLHLLVFRSARFSFMLLLCLSMPVFLETSKILNLWLSEVPEYTIIFVQLMICVTIIDAVANSLVTAANATGKIKRYQMVVGGILLLIVPISYIALLLDANPIWVCIVHICIAIIAFIARIYMIRPMIKITFYQYFMNVIKPIFSVGLITVVITLAISYFLPQSIFGFVFDIVQSILISLIVCYIIGLTRKERSFIVYRLKIIGFKNDTNKR